MTALSYLLLNYYTSSTYTCNPNTYIYFLFNSQIYAVFQQVPLFFFKKLSTFMLFILILN